jgi:hypothetical protein
VKFSHVQLVNQQTEKGNSTSVLKVSFPGNFSSLKIIPFTEADIKSTIHFLKTKKKIRL